MPSTGDEAALEPPGFPIGISGPRHLLLSGRAGLIWWRRTIVGILALVSLLGLAGIFGQCSSATLASGHGATVSVDSPPRVRGGIVLTSEVIVTTDHTVGDLRIFLARGWFQGMSVNTIEPSPTAESSNGPWVIFGFGRLLAGHQFHLWLSLQTNPTNVGGHTQDVQVWDGSTFLVAAHRSFFVFP